MYQVRIEITAPNKETLDYYAPRGDWDTTAIEPDPFFESEEDAEAWRYEQEMDRTSVLALIERDHLAFSHVTEVRRGQVSAVFDRVQHEVAYTCIITGEDVADLVVA